MSFNPRQQQAREAAVRFAARANRPLPCRTPSCSDRPAPGTQVSCFSAMTPRWNEEEPVNHPHAQGQLETGYHQQGAFPN